MRRLSVFGGLLIVCVAGAALAGGGAGLAATGDRATGPLPQYGNPNGHEPVPAAGRAVSTNHPNHVIGHGTPASCTSAAVVKAVAKGGVIVFNCGPRPVTITMQATAKVVNTSHRIVIDGGGTVTLSGADKRQILYMNTCDQKQTWTTDHCFNQQWPKLIVQNITFSDGNSQVRQTKTSNYGGGAIFDEGGQLKVVNSGFINNRCFHVGPDLGGAAIRALAQWNGHPIYITGDTFRGGRCSNGSALSSIGVSWVVLNSLMINNKATGFGANPASGGTQGGGSGGAIYTDGDKYSVLVAGTIMHTNFAREGGGAIFFVSDDNTGTLTIKDSTLHNNPSGVFWTRPYPGIYFHSSGHPKVIHSTIN
jgi:hypothetical protein